MSVESYATTAFGNKYTEFTAKLVYLSNIVI